MSAKQLVEQFAGLDDPRCDGKVEHLLIDILVIAVCAVIAGAESWVEMALYGQEKADWLRSFLALPNGIPAHDTFRRVFMLIDPEGFESRFTAWTRTLAASIDREVVAIDGTGLHVAACAAVTTHLGEIRTPCPSPGSSTRAGNLRASTWYLASVVSCRITTASAGSVAIREAITKCRVSTNDMKSRSRKKYGEPAAAN